MSAEDVHTGCDVMHLLHAAWDAGLTVLTILPPSGDVEIRLVSDRDPLGERFTGPLDVAVEAAFAHLCRATEPEPLDFCWSRGPRIGEEGAPVCFRKAGHEGAHHSHPDSGFNEGWGAPQMGVPESSRDLYWQPTEYVS